MKIKLPNEKEREIAPPGSHQAICYTVVDLGSQRGPYGTKHQLYVAWELPEELTSRDKPHTVGRFYNLVSDARGALRQDLERWFGKSLTSNDIADIDLAEELLGRTATLGVMHSGRQEGKLRAVISSVMLPAKGKPVKAQTVNDPIVFGFDGEFDQRAFEALPSWLKNIVSKSPQYRAATGAQTDTVKERLDARLNGGSKDDLDDEIPY
jgi:hypothetical protein